MINRQSKRKTILYNIVPIRWFFWSNPKLILTDHSPDWIPSSSRKCNCHIATLEFCIKILYIGLSNEIHWDQLFYIAKKNRCTCFSKTKVSHHQKSSINTEFYFWFFGGICWWTKVGITTVFVTLILSCIMIKKTMIILIVKKFRLLQQIFVIDFSRLNVYILFFTNI